MMRPLLVILLVLSVSASAAAQASSGGDYAVGWFDHRDTRSESTGLGTLIGLDSGLRSRPFKLNDPASFRPELCDMVILGSFSELDPAWNDFVRRERDRILRWVRDGGILVQMCRSGKSDAEANRKPELLPPGFEVERGGEDDDEWYCSADLLPLWRDIDDKLKREGRGGNNPSWYRRPAGAYGPLKKGAIDAFEGWSEQFTRSAGRDMRIDGRWAWALHAKYGKGQILLFQLAIDKCDGARTAGSKALSRAFFSCLMRYGRERRNPGKKRPEPVIVPDPVPPRPVPTTLRIEGRAFVDLDRDGRYDRGEPPVDLEVHDRDKKTRPDRDGRFSLVRGRSESGFLRVNLPRDLDLPGGWFRLLGPASGNNPALALDLPFRRNEEEFHRAVAVSLPTRLDDAAVLAEIESRLIRVARKEKARRVILFSTGAGAADIAALDGRLERLFAGDPGFHLYVVLDPGLRRRREIAPRDWAFDLGRWRFRSGAEAEGLDAVEGLTTVVATLGPGTESGPGIVALVPSGRTGGNPEDLTAPMLLDPADLAVEARYLVFEDSDAGALTRLEPEASEAVEEGPSRPVHRFGKGDIGALLEAAIEATKD